MKPIANLKALREYYIINNDVQSYNNFMHHVKDAILLSSNEDVWSKFINSKYFINVNTLFITISRVRMLMTLKTQKNSWKYSQ